MFSIKIYLDFFFFFQIFCLTFFSFFFFFLVCFCFEIIFYFLCFCCCFLHNRIIRFRILNRSVNSSSIVVFSFFHSSLPPSASSLVSLYYLPSIQNPYICPLTIYLILQLLYLNMNL